MPSVQALVKSCVSKYIQIHLCYRYTEHTTVSLTQQWDQLRQTVMRMQHNLEQQIQARYIYTPMDISRQCSI